MKASRVLMLLLLLASVALPLHAKKVICIDQPGGVRIGFVYNAEGYERARAKMDGVAIVSQVGGALIDCLALVANNDELVIIAHGSKIEGPNQNLIRTEFEFNGQQYRGFGNGLNLAPVVDIRNTDKFVGLVECGSGIRHHVPQGGCARLSRLRSRFGPVRGREGDGDGNRLHRCHE